MATKRMTPIKLPPKGAAPKKAVNFRIPQSLWARIQAIKDVNPDRSQTDILLYLLETALRCLEDEAGSNRNKR